MITQYGAGENSHCEGFSNWVPTSAYHIGGSQMISQRLKSRTESKFYLGQIPLPIKFLSFTN